jgi:hypothetical protein
MSKLPFASSRHNRFAFAPEGLHRDHSFVGNNQGWLDFGGANFNNSWS